MNLLNVILSVVVLFSLVIGCSQTNNTPVDEGEEESGTELSLDQSYDTIRKGVRLIMSYNAQTNTFEGTVENTTGETLQQVRVEVHLSNGVELGPTPSVDLSPGEKRAVKLTATGKDFNGWTPHAEVGSGEHGGEGDGEHGGEGDGEHGGEGGGEHGGEGEGGGEHQ